MKAKVKDKLKAEVNDKAKENTINKISVKNSVKKNTKNPVLRELYLDLLNQYGKQGWWPIIVKKGNQYISYYHINDYSYPKDLNHKFEIAIGAILTQNTTWKNVERALINLKKQGLLDYNKINDKNIDLIKEAIKPSGYFNQKTNKIIIFTEFFKSNLLNNRIPNRQELLDLWGIGRETADSILLYAYNQPIFIIDAYTKRFLRYYNINIPDLDNTNPNLSKSYDIIQEFFMRELKGFSYIEFQEYHALIVEFAKKIKKI